MMTVENGESRDESSTTVTARHSTHMQYGLEDNPPWYLDVVLGFQHYLATLGGTVAIPLILSPALCIGDDEDGQVAKSEIINTMFFVSGLVTLLQTTVGVRLPVVQACGVAYLIPSLAILALPKWKCPAAGLHSTAGDGTTVAAAWNGSNVTTDSPSDDDTPPWQERMRELQGAIIMSSLLEVLLGLSGAVGFLMRFIGPIVIAPIIILVGLSLFGPTADFCGDQWWIALMTVALVTIFSQYLCNWEVPFCRVSSDKGCTRTSFPLFKLCSVILAMLLAWLVCAILTWTDALTDSPDEWGYTARTDIRSSVFKNAQWFRFPYPFQWGSPTFSVAGSVGMVSAVMSVTLESVGGFMTCAHLVGAPPPPHHATNRGIFIQGLGCIMGGLWGTASGTTTYGQNIGVIGITKVASRRAVQAAGVIMVLLGMLGKFGSLFVAIPDPVIGGAFMTMFGMIVAVGMSNLQFVDLNSSRNQYIIGLSIFSGLALPHWMTSHRDSISVGVSEIDQILTVLLSTSMFVGGSVAFLLDNTIPGSLEERGMKQWEAGSTATMATANSTTGSLHSYDLPFGMGVLRGMKWARYVPLCPVFGNEAEPTAELPAHRVHRRGSTLMF